MRFIVAGIDVRCRNVCGGQTKCVLRRMGGVVEDRDVGSVVLCLVANVRAF